LGIVYPAIKQDVLLQKKHKSLPHRGAVRTVMQILAWGKNWSGQINQNWSALTKLVQVLEINQREICHFYGLPLVEQ